MPIEDFVEGVSEPLVAQAELLTFRSVDLGLVTGTVAVPPNATGAIVRYRPHTAPQYESTLYVIADDTAAFVDSFGRDVYPFAIPGLTPGAAYALVTQAVNVVDKSISLPSPEFLVVVAGTEFTRKMYLPPDVVHYTEFPRHDGKDLLMQVRMIEDQFKRMATRIRYFNIRSAPTPAVDEADAHDPRVLSGEVGTTKYDPLWGEEVPESVAAGELWKQPHGDPAMSVNRQRVFESFVELPAQIRREAKQRELKRWGFDEVRDVLVVIPVSYLDRYGVYVEAGDEFEWDGERYTVLQRRRDAWFFNSTTRLFVIANCEQKREGS